MSRRRFHIVLVGFMGSGKSTVGNLLAESLKMPFVDTDEEIVKSENKSISKVFKDNGESYFREIESEVLQTLLKSKTPSIISTGGGAPCHLEGMKYILGSSLSFYLKVGRSSLLERILNDKSRPLVATKTKSELKQFIDESLRIREKYYKQANQVILAYDTPEEIVDRIKKYIEKENK